MSPVTPQLTLPLRLRMARDILEPFRTLINSTAGPPYWIIRFLHRTCSLRLGGRANTR